MKKRKKLLICIGIFILCGLVAAAVMVIISHGNNDNVQKGEGYSQFVVVDEKEDGWVYFWEKDTAKDNYDEDVSYYFDAHNIKYKTLDGYKCDFIDGDTGEIIDEIDLNNPSLSLGKEKNDIDNINDFFNRKDFKDNITLNDLKELDTNIIDKEYLCELYNKLLKADVSVEGGYTGPEADIVQEQMLSGYQWQVGYVNFYGNFKAFNIELIYENGEYLSDIINSGEATEEQKEIYDLICKLESDILESQNLLVSDISDKEISGIKFLRLYNLFESMEKGTYE